MTWSWKNWDGAVGRMKNYCQKSENFWKITRLLSRWKIKLDENALIWHLRLLRQEKKLGLHKDSSVHFSFLWNAKGNTGHGINLLCKDGF